MKAKSILAVIVLFGSITAWAAEPQKPVLMYELTVDGQTYDIAESTQGELTLDGKTIRVSVRVKPIQHYATDVLEFDYDKSLALRDDLDKEGRTISLVHGSQGSIVLTQLGEAAADGAKRALAHVAERMEARFKRGVCKDLQKSAESPAQFKDSKGSTLTLTYKDEDDEQQTCKIYVLDSKTQRFSLIVQHGADDKNVVESVAKVTLESVAAK